MKAELQINRVEACLEWLATSATEYTATQSIDWLIDQVGMLLSSLAFVNNQMAVAKSALNKAKEQAYIDVMGSLEAQGKNSYPSLVKDYVNSKCHSSQYNYEICERCSRTILHTIEALRTCLSCLKEEIKVSNYQTSM